MVKEAKAKSWEDFGNDIENKAKENNTRQFRKTIKALGGKKYRKKVRSIKQGNKLITVKKSLLRILYISPGIGQILWYNLSKRIRI